MDEYKRSATIVDTIDLAGDGATWGNWRVIEPSFILGPANDDGTLFWVYETYKNSTNFFVKYIGSAESDIKRLQSVRKSNGRMSKLVCATTGSLIIRDHDKRSMVEIPAEGSHKSLPYISNDISAFASNLYHPDLRAFRFAGDVIRSNMCRCTALVVMKDSLSMHSLESDSLLSEPMQTSASDYRLYFWTEINGEGVIKVARCDGKIYDVVLEPNLVGETAVLVVSPDAKWLAVVTFTIEIIRHNIEEVIHQILQLYTNIDGIYKEVYKREGERCDLLRSVWFTKDSSHFVFIVDNKLMRMRLT